MLYNYDQFKIIMLLQEKILQPLDNSKDDTNW